MLIFPPTVTSMESAQYVCPPLGIAYIASILKNDYIVKLLDATAEGYRNEKIIDSDRIRFGLSYKAIEREIEQFYPDVLGITCLYSSQFPSVIKICRIGKKINQEMITVTGGTHPTYMFSVCLEHRELDFIVLGEGERTFRELIQRLKSGKELNNIDGLAYRNNGEICVQPKRELINNLDEILYPARDLLPMEKYFSINVPMGITSRRRQSTSLITSRGCPMHCTFCSSFRFWGNRYRTRDPENIIGEIEHLVQEYGIKEIRFHDDNLTFDKKRAKIIFREMIYRKFDLLWTAPNGISPWTLDDDLLELMKASGCYEVTLAIESGDENILRDVIKKPVDLEKTKTVIKKIKRLGMDTSAFFIIGLPGETKEQIKKTLSFAGEIMADRVSIMIANPLPGSEMFDICLKDGYINRDYRVEKNDYCRASFSMPGLTEREIEGIRNRWFLRYNLISFFRNPFKFFTRYGRIIFTRPLVALDILHLKKIRLFLFKQSFPSFFF